MLLGNDVVEGRDAQQLAEADRVYLLLKGHMRRMRDQLARSAGPATRGAAHRGHGRASRPIWPPSGNRTWRSSKRWLPTIWTTPAGPRRSFDPQ